MDTRSGNQIKGMKQYEIRSKIGSGAFGDIHIGIDTRSSMSPPPRSFPILSLS